MLWQAFTKTMKGKPMISRTIYKILGNTIQTVFQDVTHLYPEIMALPPIDHVVNAHILARQNSQSPKQQVITGVKTDESLLF